MTSTVIRRTFLQLSVAPLVTKPALAAAETPKKGGTLRVRIYIEAVELRLTLDTKLGIKLGLAESWTQPDPKTLVFKLHPG